MLCFNRIGFSKGNDIEKTSALKECVVCCYCYFLNIGFKFQLDVCNGCYGILMIFMNTSNMLF